MYGTLKKIIAFAGSKEGLLKKSLLFAFLSGLFAALQFAALFIVVEALVSDNRDSRFIWISLGIMAVSLVGRIITTYFSTMEQTETGYCMVAEKRIHIGDRLRYIPMGYFNKNSIGNITAIVTTTLGDVENSAARVLVSVLGGFFNSVALVIVLLFFDWRIGLIAAIGVLLYLAAAELALRKSARLSGVRQHTQESLVESVLEYIQGMGIVKAFGMEKDSTQSIDSAIKASCRDNLKLTKASVPYDALKQVVVRVFSVLLPLASIYFWLNGSLSLAYGVILVVASFMVFNDLENAGNMASLLQMLAASMDTANSILEGRNVKVIPSKNLKEQSFGDFEAEKSVDIFKDGVRFPDGYRFCGGENHSDVIERVTNELKKIASEYPNANVLVVCHGSAIKHIVNALCPGFVDEKPNTAALVPNCSVTRMDCDTELKLIEKPHLFHGQQTLK